MRWLKPYQPLLFSLLLFLMVAWLIHAPISQPATSLSTPQSEVFGITDFPYHIIIIDAFWQGHIPSVYELTLLL